MSNVVIELERTRDVGDVSAGMTSAVSHRRRGQLLVAAFVWSTYVWGTRIWNLLTGPELAARSTAFVTVHLLLYVASLAVGAVVGVIGWRMRREARQAQERDR